MTGLIDVHAHFVTDAYAAATGIERPDGMPGWPAWSAAEHLDLMARGGIDKAYLSVSSPGVLENRALAREVNEFGAQQKAKYPDKFGHFASLPLPDVDASIAEATYALDDLDADGVVVETNHNGVYPGDARYEPLWAELDRRSALIFVHPTSPPHAEEIALGRPRPMLEFLFDTARAASDLIFSGVLTRYPAIRWVLTHGGGALPLLADRMQLFQALVPGAADVQESVVDQLSRVWFDMAGTPFPRQIPALEAAFGTSRLVYGSDYCWTPAPLALAQIDTIDDSWRALTSDNAERLFNR
ncbi:amidohydrolase family protein [Actinoplanes sp. HUAS TT8]|uniref:amidohydrolase family protein n=1 Tax=Actinoplanes sp. HUAS TT8 TaxID=3447453 RepID=UPI003F51E300